MGCLLNTLCVQRAHTKISVHLSLVFTAMLTHGHMPSDLMKTAIVPILKNRQGDISN